jgi:hypothetical protein
MSNAILSRRQQGESASDTSDKCAWLREYAQGQSGQDYSREVPVASTGRKRAGRRFGTDAAHKFRFGDAERPNNPAWGRGQAWAGLRSGRRGPVGEAMLAKRIDHTIRSHDNPLKTNAQRQSYSRNPFDDVLYSHREQVPSTLIRLALRTTARRFIERQNSCPK